MAPVTRDVVSSAWLDEHSRKWVDAGVVTAEQADAIVRLEATPAAAAEEGLPLTTELLAYLGSVLAMMGGLFVVARKWEDLPFAGRLAVGLAIAVAGFLGGRSVGRLHGDGAERLSGFLQVIGIGGLAVTSGVVAVEAGSDDPGLTALVVGPVVMAAAALCWRNRERPLQLLALAGGFVAALAGSGAVIDSPPWVAGIGVLVVSVGLGLLAWRELVHPALVAMLLASLGLVVGAEMLQDLQRDLGVVLGLVAAAAVVAGGLAQNRMPVLAFGIIAFLVALQILLSTYVRGPLGALGVLLVGLVLVVVVIVRSTHHPTGAAT
ncbi:MAG TPA: DUF2157 domain-containing protein [Acidimicrobiales bacterium]